MYDNDTLLLSTSRSLFPLMGIFNVRLGTEKEQQPVMRRLGCPLTYAVDHLDLEVKYKMQPKCLLGTKQYHVTLQGQEYAFEAYLPGYHN